MGQLATTSNEQLIQAIFQVSWLMRQQMATHTAVKELTIQQLDSLIFIKRCKSAKMQQISQHLHVTMPTATALIDKLVAMELVTRETDATDRRIVRIVLTEVGEKLLLEGMKQKSERIDAILSFISEDDRVNLLEILKKLLQKAEITYEKK